MFDWCKVGGGSAGSAVAARLSEQYQVLLIEAGGDPHPLTYVPLMAEALVNLPMIDWQYTTEPLNNSGFVWPNQVIINMIRNACTCSIHTRFL